MMTITLANQVDPKCTRPRRSILDPFFLQGYQMAWRGEDSATIYCYCHEDVEKVVTGQQDDLGDVDMEQDMTDIGMINSDSGYPCSVCGMIFDSLHPVELHYHQCHEFQCQTCGAMFDVEKLLDIHIEEAHDVYFQTAVQHQARFYACLVCTAKFESPRARQWHLQQFHGYPKWFRFCGPLQQTRPRRATRSMTNIPCKFHLSSQGCWKGQECHFQHTSVHDLMLDFGNQALSTSRPDTVI